MVEYFARMAKGETEYVGNVDTTSYHGGKKPWHEALGTRLRDTLE
jgi:hypothetical protein